MPLIAQSICVILIFDGESPRIALKRSFFADFFVLKIAGIFAEYKNICFLCNDFLFPAEYINIRNNKSK